ncbi:MAG: hypothetical protein HY739_08180 [Desulfobacterales bacterium]|nr:hypothetical protein [Desulfobacterales bacterium]
MKKGLAVLVVLAVVLGIGLGGVALAHNWGHGGYGGNMMGQGYGSYCRNAPGTHGETKAITEKEAKSILGNYVGTNPNLKVGKITDKDTYFEAEIRTKEDSLVARLAIDKATGWVRHLN